MSAPKGQVVELTSWGLEGGGRLVLELLIPLSTDNMRKLAAIDDAIRQHLGSHLATAAPGPERPHLDPEE